MNKNMKNRGKRISYAITQWDGEERNFLVDLATGKGGEEIVAARLKSFKSVAGVKDISNSKRGIADDIDFEVLYKDGHTCTVEVKTDLKAHRTGNFVYEEFSHMNPGCFARTKADHILYFVFETGDVYVLNPNTFRDFIAEIKCEQETARVLRVKATPMGEGAYGYLVPIDTLINHSNVVEGQFRVYAKTGAAA